MKTPILFIILLAFACLPACQTSQPAGDPYTPFFENQRNLPSISIESLRPTPGRIQRIFPLELFVIHDTPGSPYRSPRTLALRLDPERGFNHWIFLDQADTAIADVFDDNGPAVFLCRIDERGTPHGWSGPYAGDNPTVTELLGKPIDLSTAFSDELLASDLTALAQDMAYVHGERHRSYDNKPYVIDWAEFAQQLHDYAQLEEVESLNSGCISIGPNSLFIGLRPLVASEDQLSWGGLGLLGIQLNRQTGAVTFLELFMH